MPLASPFRLLPIRNWFQTRRSCGTAPAHRDMHRARPNERCFQPTGAFCSASIPPDAFTSLTATSRPMQIAGSPRGPSARIFGAGELRAASSHSRVRVAVTAAYVASQDGGGGTAKWHAEANEWRQKTRPGPRQSHTTTCHPTTSEIRAFNYNWSAK